VAVLKTKKINSVLWLRQCTAGRTLSYAFITPYWTAMVSVSARLMLCLMCPTTNAPVHYHSVSV